MDTIEHDRRVSEKNMKVWLTEEDVVAGKAIPARLILEPDEETEEDRAA